MTNGLEELAAAEAGNLEKEIEYLYIFSPLGEGPGFCAVCVG